MKEKIYSKLNETIYEYVHTSGVRVFMVPKKGFLKSGAYFATHFGSIDYNFVPIGENEFKTVPDGVAHFLEHKVFEQPDNSNVFDMFSKFGGNANAYTAFDMTTYYFWCTENFKENLKILVEFVQSPYFTNENVEKEQGIIGQEIRMYDDDPNWRCYFNMLGCLYNDFPVKKDIAGTVESISEITPEILYICYNTFYHPSNMTLCLVGDFEPEDMRAYLEDILVKKDNVPEVKRKYEEEAEKIAKPYVSQKMSVSVPLYTIGFKDTELTGETEKRRAVFKIAMQLLLGKSSELYAKLYNGGKITPTFGFDYTGEKNFAFSEISDESPFGKEVAEEIISAAKNFSVSKEDFERIKRKVFGKGLSVFDDPDEYAGALSRYTVKGLDLFKLYEAYESVSQAEVENIIKTHFIKDNMALSEILM